MIDWLTNGGLYMTIIECMSYDWGTIVKLYSLEIIIFFLYMSVAFLGIKEYKSVGPKNKKVAKSFLSLTIVFALCAFSGYAIDIIGFFIPHYRIKAVLLLFLVPATAWLVYEIKVNKIVTKIMGLEDKLENALQSNKKEWNNEQ